MASQAKRVLVTGAAGQIGYSLVFLVARGDIYGPNQPVILHLLDIPAVVESLHGVVMELEDCAFPLLHGVVATTDVKEAFTDIDSCIMVGAMPRREGMERKDLLKANAGIFKVQGKALNDYAKRDVKVLVVGNPANTNCLICMNSAPDLPHHNFTCLTRLDHNRARSQIAKRLNVNVSHVHNSVIWGNHSKTQYPDVSHGFVLDFPTPGARTAIRSAVNDDAWLNGDFIAMVQNRGGAIIAARKLSSAASAAKAIVDHMRDWVHGTCPGEIVSMGVISDGSYGVSQGLIYSFPVTVSNGKWHIVQGLTVDEFSRSKIVLTEKELEEERAEATEILKEFK